MFLSHASPEVREHEVAMRQYKHLRDVVASLIWNASEKERSVDEMYDKLASCRPEDEVGRARLELARLHRGHAGASGE